MILQPAIAPAPPALLHHRSHPILTLLLRVLLVLFLILFLAVPVLSPAELTQPAIDAFNRYVRLTEARMDREVSSSSAFLYIDSLNEPERNFYERKLARGEVVVLPMETRDQGKKISAPAGLIHHWIAFVFMPGVHLSEALPILQDYDHQADYYKPDIQRSRLISKDGQRFAVYLRLYRKAIVTAVYNAEFDIRYFPVDASHIYSRSYSTRIAELQNPGTPEERELTVGNDRGYLWRLYTYSRWEERGGGLYMQIEFVALSRSVPFIFAWLVNPYIKSIPREYLSHLLTTTRTLLTSRKPAASSAANFAAPEVPAVSLRRPPHLSSLSAQSTRESPPFSLFKSNQ